MRIILFLLIFVFSAYCCMSQHSNKQNEKYFKDNIIITNGSLVAYHVYKLRILDTNNIFLRYLGGQLIKSVPKEDQYTIIPYSSGTIEMYRVKNADTQLLESKYVSIIPPHYLITLAGYKTGEVVSYSSLILENIKASILYNEIDEYLPIVRIRIRYYSGKNWEYCIVKTDSELELLKRKLDLKYPIVIEIRINTLTNKIIELDPVFFFLK